MRNISLYLLATFLITISTTINGQGVQQIWGTTLYGGSDGAGTIFSMKPDATGFKKRYDFTTSTPGDRVLNTELLNVNGKLYGFSEFGGSYNNGVLFEWDPLLNIYARKFDYNSFTRSPNGVLISKNNKIFGLTKAGGTTNKGIIYEFDIPTNTFTTRAEFDDNTGKYPVGGLVELNNKFYGLTSSGGLNGRGTLYEFDPAINALTKKIDIVLAYSITDGSMLATNGTKIYGVCSPTGVIFEWDPTTNIFLEKISSGNSLTGGMTYYNNNFYGMTYSGGVYGVGFIYEWNPTSNLFTKKADLENQIPIINDGFLRFSFADNKFYGITINGGTFNKGYVFEWDPATNISTKKINFSDQTGTPYINITKANGKFYTATSNFQNWASLIECDFSANLISLKKIFSDGNGAYPNKLVVKSGKYYGSTFGGGSNHIGTFFEFNKTETTALKKHDWDIGSGQYRVPFFSTEINGKIYGIAQNLDATYSGEIINWDISTNTYLSLHNFSSPSGNLPSIELATYNSNLYGVTKAGGANNFGVIYEWNTTTNLYTKKYDFTTVANDFFSALTLVGNKFYGLTRSGGDNNLGTIYEWDPVSNLYQTKYSFTNLFNTPKIKLVVLNSKIIGITGSGGLNGKGCIFEFDPTNNTCIKKYDFATNEESYVFNIININSKIYFLSAPDNMSSFGSIFEFDPATSAYQNKHSFNGINGNSAFEFFLSASAIASPTLNSCTSYPSITIDNSNNNQWVAITDNNGDVVAEIKANGNNLGTVSIQLYVNGGPVREDAAKKLYLDRSLTITPQTQPSSAVDIRLYITEAEYNTLKNATNSQGQSSGITSINDLGMFKNSDACNSTVVGATTTVNNTNVVYDGGGYVITGSVTSFSSFYFANKAGSSLPLVLLDFGGELQQNNVLLKWKTTNEYNTDRFIIQRSTDGRRFENIGTVPAKNNAGIQQYQYLDAAVASLGKQIIYYRLLQKDNDSRQTYSNITAIALGNKAYVIQWPNPVGNQVNLLLTVSKKEKIIVRILDLNGRSLKQDEFVAEKGSSTKSFNTEGLKKGTYIIEVRSETLHKNFKVVKQ